MSEPISFLEGLLMLFPFLTLVLGIAVGRVMGHWAGWYSAMQFRRNQRACSFLQGVIKLYQRFLRTHPEDSFGILQNKLQELRDVTDKIVRLQKESEEKPSRKMINRVEGLIEGALNSKVMSELEEALGNNEVFLSRLDKLWDRFPNGF